MKISTSVVLSIVIISCTFFIPVHTSNEEGEIVGDNVIEESLENSQEYVESSDDTNQKLESNENKIMDITDDTSTITIAITTDATTNSSDATTFSSTIKETSSQVTTITYTTEDIFSTTAEDSITSTTLSTTTQEDDDDNGTSTTSVDISSTSRIPTTFPPFTDPSTTISDKSTTEAGVIPEPAEHKIASWAIIVISILITFAILLTLLYVFRKYISRKRRLDRRRLLSNASQEGFFVGNESDSIGSL